MYTCINHAAKKTLKLTWSESQTLTVHGFAESEIDLNRAVNRSHQSALSLALSIIYILSLAWVTVFLCVRLESLRACRLMSDLNALQSRGINLLFKPLDMCFRLGHLISQLLILAL